MLFFFKKRGKVRTLVLSRKKVFLYLSSFFCISVLLIIAGIYYFSDFVYQSKLAKMKNDNTQLVSTIYNMQTRMKSMESEVKVLMEKDKALRTYVDIPEIDKDIRKLGIGGKIVNRTTELNKLLPGDTIKISGLIKDLDKLAREIKLELSSYNSIYEAAQHHSEQIQCTPSIRPVRKGYITDGFGYRKDPFTYRKKFHYGVDISCPTGTNVYVTANGVVSNTNVSRSSGKYLLIDHGFGYSTFYGHLSRIIVKHGEVVKRGQKIGEVGSTGRSTAPHLHYEVRQFSIKKDPLEYFFTPFAVQ